LHELKNSRYKLADSDSLPIFALDYLTALDAVVERRVNNLAALSNRPASTQFTRKRVHCVAQDHGLPALATQVVQNPGLKLKQLWH
jgi:hypothetical protein